ncbi:TIGR03364 family FAD-dependent oxidoreductase [Mycetocola tolaasinivorans]|uniref:TIGR03364 family FAD-dependent oxidoreductase n=1 Tax=Mycetocola tolaasinivorans TaxID=76635 RepID=A0A3L7A9A4_9MICO|nr:TIGR03364 family FAD-dependent oxidoreductase [Mycetocola tolaasinivorans]RLP76438.1 TIGR03364 family FAD-dependent oxidoreductase [Mycetocola tolaasinivorans]
MTTTPTPPQIVIVGAGIIGLSHAVAALDAGYRVTVLEQDARAVSASIRNFGHLGFGAHGGEHGVLADEARPLWLSIAERAGVAAHRTGTLVLARDAAEREALDEARTQERFANAAALDADRTAALLGRASASPELAGLLLPGDLTVDPRTAVATIAAWVNAHERGRVRFGTAVFAAEDGRVVTARGDVFADHVIVTAGHLIGRLYPEIAEDHGIGECALQMLRVRARAIDGPGAAVLTGTSMLRYSAFSGPAIERLRAHLTETRPELLAIQANIMLTRHTDGTILIGDTHAAHRSAPPFLSETWSQIVLAEITDVLGAGPLEVLERWQGVYAQSATHGIVTTHPRPGVTAVTVTTGIGMTLGPALGARTVGALTLSLPATHS